MSMIRSEGVCSAVYYGSCFWGFISLFVRVKRGSQMPLGLVPSFAVCTLSKWSTEAYAKIHDSQQVVIKQSQLRL